MKKTYPNEYFNKGEEKKKRRKEIVSIVVLTFLFLFLTWVEFKILNVSRTLPLVHSIFFFGLLNFNIILFIFLSILIFRNIVKVFVEKKSGVMGGTLKKKLVIAFVTFSFVPTILMFLISVFYINNSFDKWFNVKISSVLKSSLEVTNEYYSTAKIKNYHFATQISDKIKTLDVKELEVALEKLGEDYSLDTVEVYKDVFTAPTVYVNKNKEISNVPRVSLEFLKKGIISHKKTSVIHHFGEGSLIRAMIPFKHKGKSAAVVVSSYVPISLISRMDDISSAYNDFRDINPIQYPLKSIYLIILIVMTLAILFFASWFGFHLARHLSIPLEVLGEATRNVAKGLFKDVEIKSGSKEINELIGNFNTMTDDLKDSKNKATTASLELKDTLSELDKHSKYMEIILANISTGVISVDSNGVIKTINDYASSLLKLNPGRYLETKVSALTEASEETILKEFFTKLNPSTGLSLKKEIHLMRNNQILPIQAKVDELKFGSLESLGFVYVFDDLTAVVNVQRANAWKEVARRITHEIKNPLTPIRLAAQRLEKKFSHIEDDSFKECTDMIIEQVDDMKNLVNEFNNFSKMPKTKPVPGDLNQMVTKLAQFYNVNKKAQSDQSQNVVFLDLDPSLPIFKFDTDQIKRAMANLIENSMFALQDKSDAKIKIQTKYNFSINLVKITIEDNGPGISAKLINRIFEPYITSKPSGTGLGLAIVKKTIDDHNGVIRAHSKKEQGTKFVIDLPIFEVLNEKVSLDKLISNNQVEETL